MGLEKRDGAPSPTSSRTAARKPPAARAASCRKDEMQGPLDVDAVGDLRARRFRATAPCSARRPHRSHRGSRGRCRRRRRSRRPGQAMRDRRGPSISVDDDDLIGAEIAHETAGLDASACLVGRQRARAAPPRAAGCADRCSDRPRSRRCGRPVARKRPSRPRAPPCRHRAGQLAPQRIELRHQRRLGLRPDGGERGHGSSRRPPA